MSFDEEWTDEPVLSGISAINMAYGNGHFLICGYLGSDGAIAYAASPEGPWELANLPSDIEALRGATYADGIWVLVGRTPSNDGVIVTATTPSGTWTKATIAAGTPLWDVAYGSGVWTACGSSGVATATDPTGTWTINTSGIPGGVLLGGIAHGASKWVSVGGADIYYATDPTGSWSSTSFGGTPVDVAYGGGDWLVVGRSGASAPYGSVAKTATDAGGTWSSVSIGGETYGGWTSVTYADSTWVVTGDNLLAADEIVARYAPSPSSTWLSVTVGTGDSVPYAAFGDGEWAVVVGAGRDSVAFQTGDGEGWGLLLR